MPATYKASSPYFATPQRNFIVKHLDFLQFRSIPSDSTDQIIKVSSKFNQRPDLLSNDLYQTPDLWWIFAVRNPNAIIDPIYDLITDLEISVPTKIRVFSLLGL